jgi:hypothetical protein
MIVKSMNASWEFEANLESWRSFLRLEESIRWRDGIKSGLNGRRILSRSVSR